MILLLADAEYMPLASNHSLATDFNMPTNNNTILIVIHKPIVLLQNLLLALAIARHATTTAANLNRRNMPILVVRNGAELDFVVEWLVAMRTATVATDAVRCTSRVRLLRAAGAEVQEALKEWAKGCDVADKHTKGRFGVAPDENVREAIEVVMAACQADGVL